MNGNCLIDNAICKVNIRKEDAKNDYDERIKFVAPKLNSKNRMYYHNVYITNKKYVDCTYLSKYTGQTKDETNKSPIIKYHEKEKKASVYKGGYNNCRLCLE